MASTKATTTDRVYQLKICLKYDDTIWRRVLVRSDSSLLLLHYILQAVMGWANDHMHSFQARGRNYGDRDPLFDLENKDDFTLGELLPRARQKMEYEYDFGDSWVHEIRVEKILPPDESVRCPVCIAGERASPPEDCGGLGGYEMLLETLSDPEDPEHENMLEWVGGEFDPEAFDIDKVNRRLEGLRPRPVRVRADRKVSPASKKKPRK